MKKILSILFLFIALNCWCATRYNVTGGTGNWNSTTNWSTSSGGGSGASFPTLSDDVIFDANSNTSFTVNVASAALSLTCTGYSGAINMGGILTVTGNITLGTGMTFTGANAITLNATSTITNNSVLVPNFSLGAATFTITLADDFNCTNLNFNGSGTYQINTHNFKVGGNFAGNSAIATGTSTVVTNGTGTVSGLRIANPFVINTAGTITFSGSNQWNNSGSSFTWLAGSTSFIGSTCIFVSSSVNSGGSSLTFNNVTFSGVITLGSDLYMSGTMLFGNAVGATLNGSFRIYASATITANTGGNTINGTATLVPSGTGTISSATNSDVIANTIEINTTGTVTIGTLLVRSTNPITYIANTGTVVTTGSTLRLPSSCTIDASAIIWNNIVAANAITLTLNSNLNVGGTLSCISNLTLAGSGGATINTLSLTVTGTTYILQASNTYSVTNSLTIIGTSGTHTIFKSSSSSVRAIFALANGATQNVRYCDPTWIDSSAGKKIYSLKLVQSNTLNWSKFPNNFNTFN